MGEWTSNCSALEDMNTVCVKKRLHDICDLQNLLEAWSGPMGNSELLFSSGVVRSGPVQPVWPVVCYLTCLIFPVFLGRSRSGSSGFFFVDFVKH